MKNLNWMVKPFLKKKNTQTTIFLNKICSDILTQLNAIILFVRTKSGSDRDQVLQDQVLLVRNPRTGPVDPGPSDRSLGLDQYIPTNR